MADSTQWTARGPGITGPDGNYTVYRRGAPDDDGARALARALNARLVRLRPLRGSVGAERALRASTDRSGQ